MDIEYVNCKLIAIKQLDRGSYIALKRIIDDEIVTICVNDSKEKIESRMREVLKGERKNIYLSNGMTNVNINTSINQDWDIHEETGTYYKFKKNDVEELLN